MCILNVEDSAVVFCCFQTEISIIVNIVYSNTENYSSHFARFVKMIIHLGESQFTVQEEANPVIIPQSALDLHNTPGLEERPELQDARGLREKPNLQNAPSLQEEPELQDGPGLQEESNLQDPRDLQDPPVLQDQPDLPDQPDLQEKLVLQVQHILQRIIPPSLPQKNQLRKPPLMKLPLKPLKQDQH